MRFWPDRKPEAERAICAGLIASERGSRVIEMDDWDQAGKARPRPPTPEEYEKLRLVSVSDEVVRKVADERFASARKGRAQQPGKSWPPRPASAKPDDETG